MTTLQRKPCPRCQRVVAWRVIRDPRVNQGRYGAIPPLMQPVRHRRPLIRDKFGVIQSADWCVPTRVERP